MYFLQQWFSPADEAVEDALHDSQSMRDFVGIDPGREPVPDATTLLKFRRLLQDNELTAKLFEGINTDGCMPFRVDCDSHSFRPWRLPIPPPFPPAGRERVALCRQGCRPEGPWPTPLWPASCGLLQRQGQALRVACGQGDCMKEPSLNVL